MKPPAPISRGARARCGERQPRFSMRPAGAPVQANGLLPIARNLRRRSSRRRAPSCPSSGRSASSTASPSARDRLVRRRCAPPSGSATMRSMTPSRSRSCAVSRRASAASWACAGVAPQDRGAAFRRDHRIDRVLQHQHGIAGGERDRAARAAFADDRGDERHPRGRGRSRSRARSPRSGRAPRHRCRDRRRRCRRRSAPAAGSARPAASGGAPCDSLRAAPCRNCASPAPRCRRLSRCRGPPRCGRGSGRCRRRWRGPRQTRGRRRAA